MPASIFNGDSVKILKDKLKFKNGQTVEADGANIATSTDFVAFQGTAKEMEVGEEIFETLSTGLKSFDGLSINGGDTTKFDVGAVSGHVIDIASDTYVSVNEVATTLHTPTTANGVNYVFMTSAGAISQQTTAPSPNDLRDMIYLGRVITISGTVVQTQNEPNTYLSSTNQFYDLCRALRIFNISGNIVSTNGANLKIDKSLGELFSVGANFVTDSENPHHVSIAAASPQSFAYITQLAGSTGSIVSDIDPLNYDNAGVVTAIGGSNNQATIQRIYQFPSGNVRIAYGQTIYAKLSDAVQAINTESFIENPSIAGNGILLAIVVVTKGCTDLSDTSTARILAASRFGQGSVGASGQSVSDLQDVVNNSSPLEATLLNAIGGMTLKDASVAIAGTLFAISDNAGTTNYFDVRAEYTNVSDSQESFTLHEESDIRYLEQFKVNAPSVVYTESGLTNSVVDDSTTEMDLNTTAKFTVTTGDDAGTITSDAVTGLKDVDFQLLGFNFDWAQDSGVSGDWSLKIQESTDDVTYTDIATYDLPETSDESRNIQLNFKLSSTAVYYRHQLICNNATNSATMRWANIKVVKNPLPVAESIEADYVKLQVGNGHGSTNNKIRRFSQIAYNAGTPSLSSIAASQTTPNGFIKITDSATDGTEFEILKRGEYTFTYQDAWSTGQTNFGFSINSTQLTTDLASINDANKLAHAITIAANGDSVVSYTGHFKVGDVVRCHTQGLVDATSGSDLAQITISAKAVSNNVVFQGQTSELDTNSYTPSIVGFGTVTNSNLYYSLINDKLLITGSFTSGTSTAVEAQIPLPSGYTVKSGMNITAVGSVDQSVNLPTAMHVAATGDDSFLNFTYLNTAGLTPLNGNGIASSGTTTSFTAIVPVNENKASDAIYSVPVTNEVENSFWMNIDATGAITESGGRDNGVTANLSATNRFTVDYSSLGLTEIPTPSLIEISGGSNRYFVESISTTQFVYQTTNSSGTGIAYPSSISLNFNGADYKAPQGYFLGNMPSTAHITGGTEYATAETWNGKRIYARSYEVSSDIASNTVIDTINTNLNIIDKMSVSTGVFLVGGSHYLLQLANYAFITYTQSTGVITTVQNGETIRAGTTFILRYTK